MCSQPSDSPTIRCLAEDETGLWAAMRARLWPDATVEEHVRDVEAMRGPAALVAYAAFDGAGTPVGFAEVSIRAYANGCTGRPVPFLEGIWVAPGHRRRGVGGSLLARIGADLTARGFEELCSDAEIGNRTSRRAHKGWGFAETERVVCFRKPLA